MKEMCRIFGGSANRPPIAGDENKSGLRLAVWVKFMPGPTKRYSQSETCLSDIASGHSWDFLRTTILSYLIDPLSYNKPAMSYVQHSKQCKPREQVSFKPPSNLILRLLIYGKCVRPSVRLMDIRGGLNKDSLGLSFRLIPDKRSIKVDCVGGKFSYQLLEYEAMELGENLREVNNGWLHAIFQASSIRFPQGLARVTWIDAL
ncbi:uncharacterized protein BDR25DRAFT_354082 [Lindgomyces ingoldianus]|uniref:Uncharacterized protein n=1 Tax=Lindgomyces ingoldianus TaxID=673940 RepID=A0ACB6QX06_9PLEO|nr:uncharacterized protein BDR25DRAFT_354082 [Lindgomyces ingoldianus]KAF2471553.1 hypothetical protein BDR25DRAFT_354082 [Lindgomyces ingoldianus]